MSGALDAAMVSVAKDTINKFGKDLLYLDLGDLSYNPLTGGITTPTETSKEFVGAVMNINTKTGSQQIKAGEVYKMGDFMIMAAADDFAAAPEEGRQIVLGGTIASDHYTILGVDPLYSGNEVAVYKIHVRK